MLRLFDRLNKKSLEIRKQLIKIGITANLVEG